MALETNIVSIILHKDPIYPEDASKALGSGGLIRQSMLGIEPLEYMALDPMLGQVQDKTSRDAPASQCAPSGAGIFRRRRPRAMRRRSAGPTTTSTTVNQIATNSRVESMSRAAKQ